MKIRRRLAMMLVLFTVVLGSVVATLLATLQVLHTSHQAARQFNRDLVLHVTLGVNVCRFMHEMNESIIFQSHRDREEMEVYRGRVNATFVSITALQAQLEEHEASRREYEAQRLQRLRNGFKTAEAHMDGLLERKQQGRPVRDELRKANRELEKLLEVLTEEAVREEAEDLESLERELKERAALLTAAGAGIPIVSFALLLAVVGTTIRRLSKNLGLLVKGTQAIAKGDLEARLPEAGSGEFEMVATAFNAMAADLSALSEEKLKAERLAVLGKLAAGVGHELRNPLGAISNAIYYLRKRVTKTQLSNDERVMKFFDLMEREQQACLGIITNLLDYAKPRAPVLAPCPLFPLVDSALSVVRPPRPMSIENQVSEDLPVPLVDGELLRQVLINLIQNGAEAIPEDRAGRITITATATQDEILLQITDNGSGMPEEAQNNIFNPLFTTKTKGTGLGLFICATIMSRLGGRLAVESLVDEGSTFIVHLPRTGAVEAGED